MTSRFLILLIKIYQIFLSNIAPVSCKFYPSCSNYAIAAISKFGPLGILLIIKRVILCSGFSHGGYDPIESSKKDS